MSKVLHIITGLQLGGAERSLYNLLACGLNAEHQNFVLSLSNSGDLGSKLEAADIPVHTLGLDSLKNIVLLPFRLRRIIKDIKPDALQGWMYHGNLVATLGMFLSNSDIKLIWNVRQTLYSLKREKPLTCFVIILNRLLSRFAEIIIYNSEVARAQHENFGFSADCGRVIANGFDVQRWRPCQSDREAVRNELSIPSDAIVLGFTARYHPMKNLKGLLRAIGPVILENPRLHLIIVGRGNDKKNPELKDAYAQLPDSQVHILEQRDDIAELMRGFDLFCVPSSWGEGFPNVLGEAMATGLLCMTTDVGDSSRVLGDCGVLVGSPHDTQLREGVLQMLSYSADERARRGMQARRRIVTNYLLQATVNDYIELYEFG